MEPGYPDMHMRIRTHSWSWVLKRVVSFAASCTYPKSCSVLQAMLPCSVACLDVLT